MTGYQRSTLRLVFDDPDLAGLEVKARRLTIRELLVVGKLQDGLELRADDALQQVEELAAALSAPLLSWNLQAEPKGGGDPVAVPLTSASLVDQDLGLLLSLASELGRASVKVSRPLARPSDGGVPSPEPSIPMEPLSASPETSETPD